MKTKEPWLALMKLVSNGEVNLATEHAKQISNGKEMLKMMGFDLV